MWSAEVQTFALRSHGSFAQLHALSAFLGLGLDDGMMALADADL